MLYHPPDAAAHGGMNMRIGLCDDNKADLEAMHGTICHTGPDLVPDSYSDSTELLSAIKSGIRYDLLFLDILMPGLSGMELAWEISRISPDTSIVFLTDSTDFAVEAFSVKALHYLIKPLTEAGFAECMSRMYEKRQAVRRQISIMSSSGQQHMFFADEIHYAQSKAHYWHLYLTGNTVVKTRMTQSEILETLGKGFLPISRGLVVNADFIRQFGLTSCILKDGREILLSRNNRKMLHETYGAYVFSQLKGDSKS